MIRILHAILSPVLGASMIFLSASCLQAATTCDVRALGAKGDGKTKDTAAIQKAIDDCAQKGGGTVRLSAGTYLSAPIVLKSNITLQIDKGATLLASTDRADYPPKTEFHVPDVQPFLGAENAENISIRGEGTIDGNGESWWIEARSIKDHGVLGNHPRPKLMILDHCKHVKIEGVTIQNSPMWQLVPYYTDDIVIRNVRILAPPDSPNTDAIDPFSSSNVVIDHVYADVGDDNVAIKSGPINSPGPDSPSHDITITDCTFKHGHGVSIGSEIAGGVQNVKAERIHFEGTDNGIRVKANRDRGNDVGGLVFRDIDMKDVKNAIVITEYYPKVMPPDDNAAQPMGRLTPRFHNILLENVTAVNAETAGAIVGLPESPVQDVVMRNVKIKAGTGLSVGFASVSGHGVVIQAAKGNAIEKSAGADVTLQ
jgi:polygalacturonase